MTDVTALGKAAFEAAAELSLMGTAQKNALLIKLAESLEAAREKIFAVNVKEVEKARASGLNPALCDRLLLTESRFNEMTGGVRKVAELPDPVGRLYDGRTAESSLRIIKKTVPLGVVGVIYESRPNVTVDIAALCLKSSNCCLLRGGSEAFETNSLLHEIMAETLKKEGVNPAVISFVDDPDRALIKQMLSLNEYIDVIIPRGGEKLQRMCQQESAIPVIIGGFGISHIFVDETADLKRSVEVIVNAKTQKPSACNALDTLLVHRNIASAFIPQLLKALREKKVEVLAHGEAMALCRGYPYIDQGKEADFDTEFLALKLNLTLVKDVNEACLHMRKHRASHSDAILTDSRRNADIFCQRAGSACVYVNASTRFSDGGQFGLGAEVAISTQKLHARGPMALEALTTYQYVCEGDYLSRA